MEDRGVRGGGRRRRFLRGWGWAYDVRVCFGLYFPTVRDSSSWPGCRWSSPTAGTPCTVDTAKPPGAGDLGGRIGGC